jgi:hypothetical protein
MIGSDDDDDDDVETITGNIFQRKDSLIHNELKQHNKATLMKNL